MPRPTTSVATRIRTLAGAERLHHAVASALHHVAVHHVGVRKVLQQPAKIFSVPRLVRQKMIACSGLSRFSNWTEQLELSARGRP